MEKKVQLERSLNPANVWAIALGAIIGFGCFIMPSDFLKDAGPIGASIGILLGALIMMVVGRSYGYLISAFPVAGGEFAYAYKGFGRTHAFLCGWFLTLGYLSLVPLNATALAVLAKFIAPGVFAKGYLYTIAGFDVYVGEILLATVAILFFAFWNYKGVKDFGRVQLIMCVLLVASVVFIGIGTLMSPVASFEHLKPYFASDKSMVAGILAILAIAPWLYVGFDTIPQAAEEYDFPPTKAFRLIVVALIFGALTYITVLLATAMVFPWQELISQNLNWATGTAVEASIGMIGVICLCIAICMGIFTGINGFFMASSRLLFGMARSKVLPAAFAQLHPVYKTPYKALIFVTLISLIAPWFGRQVISWVVDMSALGTTFGYLYTCLTGYKLIKQGQQPQGGLNYTKLHGGLGAVFSLIFLLLLCVPGSPGFMSTPSWIALSIWVLIGLSFYIYKRKEYNSIPDRILNYYVLQDTSGLTDEEKIVVGVDEEQEKVK